MTHSKARVRKAASFQHELTMRPHTRISVCVIPTSPRVPSNAVDPANGSVNQ